MVNAESCTCCELSGDRKRQRLHLCIHLNEMRGNACACTVMMLTIASARYYRGQLCALLRFAENLWGPRILERCTLSCGFSGFSCVTRHTQQFWILSKNQCASHNFRSARLIGRLKTRANCAANRVNFKTSVARAGRVSVGVHRNQAMQTATRTTVPAFARCSATASGRACRVSSGNAGICSSAQHSAHHTRQADVKALPVQAALQPVIQLAADVGEVQAPTWIIFVGCAPATTCGRVARSGQPSVMLLHIDLSIMSMASVGGSHYMDEAWCSVVLSSWCGTTHAQHNCIATGARSSNRLRLALPQSNQSHSSLCAAGLRSSP